MGAAKIAREKVIPGLQAGNLVQVVALASRDLQRARQLAGELHIPMAFGSYEELLSSEEVDAVYIPLPNHLHVEWSLKAIAAGKHVLCEKPVALSYNESLKLLNFAAEHPGIKVMEAFMYRFHPQWQSAKKLVEFGRIGTLKTIQSVFAYFNNDPANIRNQVEMGGGGLMDIGCYCISLSRYIFNSEPVRVIGIIENDPDTATDRLTSGIMDFGNGTSTFTCSTQLTPFQRVFIYGTEGCIEIEIPFNAPPNKATRTWIHSPNGNEEIVFDAVDQYTLQADAFSKAIIHNLPVPTPLSDAANNMRIIEAIIQSASDNSWKQLN